ncbi:MAG: vWA domain-containing protein, partial [Planctomycetaceae bacterium]
MSWINPLILYGLGLAALPVILHFQMRAKPRKLTFPALRLIQTRRKTNVRRLRLRHVWLLLLRIAVIALLVFAIARPSLPAAEYELSVIEMLTLLGIAVVALGAYFGIMAYWRNARLPHHVFTYRRTLLRGGTGLAALLLLLLLVAWPYQRRIAADYKAPLPDIAEHLPAAAVFLFDTSLSMEYQQEGETRLQVARQIAVEHLSSLPNGSRAAVADVSSDGPVLFQADLVGAKGRIDALETRPVSVPLGDRLRTALLLQEDDRRATLDALEGVPKPQRKDRFLREVYVFTDLARSAWGLSQSEMLKRELERLEWVNVYLIDVGVEQPTNVAVAALTLSRQTVPQGGQLIVRAEIDATGSAPQQAVELYIRGEGGNLIKQGQASVTDGNTQAAFPIAGLTGPIVQGEVRLTASDPLAIDDVRYFTVAVRPPPRVLIVADDTADAALWKEAIAPAELERLKRSRYDVTVLRTNQLGSVDLNQFHAVCLINVHAPTQE